jgi:hypothetical protein
VNGGTREIRRGCRQDKGTGLDILGGGFRG